MPWPYQLDLIDILVNFRDIIFFKSRALGFTWLLSGFSIHKARFGESVKGMLSSQGEKEAMAFLDKTKYIHNHLPLWMQFRLKHPDNKEMMDFAENDSVLEILPATSKAGRSTDATFVIRDELATHPNAKENFAAISPTIDRGGQAIDVSTIDQMDATSHFTERVNRALKGARRRDLPSGLSVFYGGESGAILAFGGCQLRPLEGGLTFQEWYAIQEKRYSPQQLRQEHPKTIEDALQIPTQSMFYDGLSLNEMLLLYSGMPAILTDEVNTRNGMIEVYRPRVIGEKYCLYTDPSTGAEDPFHTVVLKTRTGEDVCEATGYLPAEEVAQLHDELVRYYNNADNSYEANAEGGGTVGAILNNLGTPNQAPRRRPEGETIKDALTGGEKHGQYMTEQHLKKYLEGLELPIRRKEVIIYRRETIEQMKTLVRKKDEKTGIFEKVPHVPKGKHNDAIMAWAGVWQLKQYVPTGKMTVTSFKWGR